MKTKTELKSNPNAKMAEHMKMWKLGATLVLILGCLAQPALIAANAVIDWNAIASQAIQRLSRRASGPGSALDLAMVQAAVYDAVQAIDGRYKPYHVEIPGASGSPRRPPPRPRTMCSSTASLTKPRRSTRPTTTTWPARPGGGRPRCGRGPAGRCRYNRPAGQ